jgi:HK97 family phage major capsid protein
MRTSAEVRARLDEIAATFRAVADGTDTETDEARLAELTGEFDSLEGDLPAIVRREEIAAAPVARQESGAATRRAPVTSSRDRDPFALDMRTASVGDLRESALTAIERAAEWMTDEHRENATALVRNAGRYPVPEGGVDHSANVARHMLLTGSDDYHDEYFAYLRTGHVGPTMQRAAMSLTGANGGYMVPFTLDPSIILTNNGAINPFRNICRVVTTTTNTWNGVTSAGATAYYGAEAAALTEGAVTVGQPSITPTRGTVNLTASMEVADDANLAAEVGMLIADARDRLDATKLVSGGGSASNEPWGISYKLSTVAGSLVSATTAGLFDAAQFWRLTNALPARHRPGSSYLGEQYVYNLIRQFDVYGGGSFWTDLGGGKPPLLNGRPAVESSAMASSIVGSTTNQFLIVGDFQKFILCDRIGTSVTYVPPGFVVDGSGVPTGQASWVAFWRFGSLVADTGAFRLLMV